MSHVSNFVVAKPWWLAGRQTALQNGSWRESDMQEVEDTTWNHISYTCTSTARLTKKPFFQLCTNYHAHQSSSSDHSHVCLFTFQNLKYPPKTSNFPIKHLFQFHVFAPPRSLSWEFCALGMIFCLFINLMTQSFTNFFSF